MIKQHLEPCPINYVSVQLRFELGHTDDEYSIHITGLIGSLDIWSAGGADDIGLIKDCIVSNIDSLTKPRDGFIDLTLRESGEWQDVFWVKFYEIERCVLTELDYGKRDIK